MTRIWCRIWPGAGEALVQRAGLGDLVAEYVRPGGACGVNGHLKVPCLVAGMAAGATS